MDTTVNTAESIVKDFDYRVKLAVLLRRHVDLAMDCQDKDKARAQLSWAFRNALEDNVSIEVLMMPEQAFQDRIQEGGI